MFKVLTTIFGGVLMIAGLDTLGTDTGLGMSMAIVGLLLLVF